MSVQLPPQPARIAALRKDHRGYPIPWFIQWMLDGEPRDPGDPGAEPDFRIIDQRKRVVAMNADRCWVCGQQLGIHRIFAIGPMCVINRVSMEPPSHRDCAEFSAVACPFLLRPRMKRLPTDDLPEGFGAAGIMLERNPGVIALYEVNGRASYRAFDAGNGWLIKFAPPVRIDWWAEGRRATRAEITESIDTGYPFLHRIAEQEGPEALAELSKMRQVAMAYLPADVGALQ